MWLGLLALVAVLWILNPWMLLLWRRMLSHRKYIEPVLRKNGYQLVSIHVPAGLSRGPFPRPRLMSLGSVLRIPLGGLEYVEYRQVEALDPTGQPATLWFELHFVSFTLIETKWKQN
jgi:hypothetical protein